MRKFFLLTLQWGLTGMLWAQSGMPSIVPPTPNAAALQRYGDIPVSAYTGVPQISVPIYEVAAGEIKVPVSVSYHASGNRVSDEASKVGLGWALNAGGVITRTIHGQDDWAYTAFNYHATTSVPEFNDVFQFRYSDFYVQRGCSPINLPGNPNLDTYLRQDYDFQPDIYTFNINGYTGKFMLRRGKAVILGEKQKLLFTPLDANATQWSLRTPDGMLYLFEESENYLDLNNNAPRISAWYITKIISPKKDTVYFDYRAEANRVYTVGSFTEFTNVNVFNQQAQNTNGCVGQTLQASTFPQIRRQNAKMDYKNLTLIKIRFKLGEVVFNYSGGREDVENDVKLDNVQVYTKNPDASLSKLKEWAFSYGYFEGAGDNDYSTQGALATGFMAKRLKLTAIQEKDPSGNAIPPYQFTYNHETTDPVNLPAKSSFARDHWGYWNGKTQNTSLIPGFTSSNSTNIAAFYLGKMGTERSADPAYTGLFMLKSITYPTKGRTEFEFESNTYDIKKSSENDKSFFEAYPETGTGTASAMYVFNRTGLFPDDNGTVPQQYILNLNDLYLGPNETTSTVTLQAFFRFLSPQPNCQLTQYLNKLYVSLFDGNGQRLSGPTDVIASLGSFSTCAGNGAGITFQNTYTLRPGIYYWQIDLGQNADLLGLLADAQLNVDYTTRLDLSSITYEGQQMKGADYGGGLRIKRIKDYDDENLNPKVRHYQYHGYQTGNIKEPARLFSYGKRMSRPIYSYYEPGYYTVSCDIGGNIITFPLYAQHLCRESESNIPLNGSASGQLVGYDRVVVLQGETGQYGKTEMEYENAPDLILDYSVEEGLNGTSVRQPRKPPAIPTIPNFGNGNLLRQTDYEWKGNVFAPVQEIINTYTDFSPTVSAWLGIEKRVLRGNYVPGPLCIQDSYIYPAIVERRKLLTATLTKTYDRVSGMTSQQTKSFTYDHGTHLQMTESVTSVSKSELVKLKTSFPLDYQDADADPAIIAMKSDAVYMHAVPVTTTTVVRQADGTERQTAGSITRYQQLNGMVLAKETAVFETNTGVDPNSIPVYRPVTQTYPTGYAPKILYDNYNDLGRITQVRKKDDIPLVYVWDNGSMYPVAEVKNALSGEVAFTSFETNETGNWQASGISYAASGFTGQRSAQLGAGSYFTATGLVVGKAYVVSYWSATGTLSIAGSSVRTGATRGGWTLYEHTINSSSGSVTVSSVGSATIDELRLYPANAQMTSYTYSPLVGLVATCTPNNMVNHYVYDGLNRLVLIKDFEGNVVKTFEYRYKQ